MSEHRDLNIITEAELKELVNHQADDGPLSDVIETHDGDWVRDGSVFRWKEREELSVPYRVSISTPHTPTGE